MSFIKHKGRTCETDAPQVDVDSVPWTFLIVAYLESYHVIVWFVFHLPFRLSLSKRNY